MRHASCLQALADIVRLLQRHIRRQHDVDLKPTNKQTDDPRQKAREFACACMSGFARVCVACACVHVRVCLCVWLAAAAMGATDLDQVVDTEVERTDSVHSNNLRQYFHSG